MDGPGIWGTPSGDDQVTFKGKQTVTTVPGLDNAGLDVEIYGTAGNDRLQSTHGSPVIFGGDGDDVILANITTTENKYTFPYYAGGAEGDTYAITPTSSSEIMVFDSDQFGRLILDGNLIQDLILCGTGFTHPFECAGIIEKGSFVYAFKITGDAPDELDILANSNYGIEVFPYTGGTFNILLATNLYSETTCFPDEVLVSALPTGNVAAVCRDGEGDNYKLETYDLTGKVLSSSSVSVSGNLDPDNNFFMMPVSNQALGIYWEVNDFSKNVDNLWLATYSFAGKPIEQSIISSCSATGCFIDMTIAQSQNNIYSLSYQHRAGCSCTTSDMGEKAFNPQAVNLDSNTRMGDGSISYTYEINNGNKVTLIQSATENNGDIIVADRNGNVIIKSISFIPGDLKPSCVLPNGDLLVGVLPIPNSLYINASGIQPPFPTEDFEVEESLTTQRHLTSTTENSLPPPIPELEEHFTRPGVMPQTSSAFQVTPFSFFKPFHLESTTSSFSLSQITPKQNEDVAPAVTSSASPLQNLDGNIALAAVGFHWLSQGITAVLNTVQIWRRTPEPTPVQQHLPSVKIVEHNSSATFFNPPSPEVESLITQEPDQVSVTVHTPNPQS